MLTSSVRKNKAELENLLAEGFVEFGVSGKVYSRESIIQALSEETETKYSADRFKATELSKNAVLVTYRATCIDHAGKRSTSLRSSIWKLDSNKWQMVFHQGTLVK